MHDMMNNEVVPNTVDELFAHLADAANDDATVALRRAKLAAWKKNILPQLEFGSSSNPFAETKETYDSKNTLGAVSNGNSDINGNEQDPLDQYMSTVASEVERINSNDVRRRSTQPEVPHIHDKSVNPNTGGDESGIGNAETGINSAGENEIAGEDDEVDEDVLAFAVRKLAKKKELVSVDHSKIEYHSFRRDFWIEPPELAEMTHDQVRARRAGLDGIRVVGKDCPKPVLKWTHCGLPTAILACLRRHQLDVPTPVQAQCIPAIMAGRDVIAVARTGSGKTLAFLLPLLRHVKDQPPCVPGQGPVALILTPTRELAMQIHKEANLFAKTINLRASVCYGGAPISEHIAVIKRGSEILVATPGRLIDLLCSNAGRVLSLRRITFLVLDEADRMFDMGFEPQVTKIIACTRPDRQTVMFSATFPRTMEALARKVLRKPLEIAVGARTGAVAQSVSQQIEIIPETGKFLRLLDLLGRFFHDPSRFIVPDTGNADMQEISDAVVLQEPRALVFVDRQEAADHLMGSLLKRGYVCNSLHGGKDQMDRDSTIADFKAGNFDILIATSVAARGLDVKGLALVVNFDCPNHREDYVHRVGRTGRAGKRGTAYTFITPEQERYAPDIVEALKQSKAVIPEDLLAMATAFREKVKAGQAQRASKGFGGKGLEKLDKERDNMKMVQKVSHGGADIDDDNNNNNNENVEEDEDDAVNADADTADADADAPKASGADTGSSIMVSSSHSICEIVLPPTVATSVLRPATGVTGLSTTATAQEALTKLMQRGKQNTASTTVAAAVAAAAAATTTAVPLTNASASAGAAGAGPASPAGNANEGESSQMTNFTCEFVINDYPQRARWTVTNKDQIVQVCENSGAAITTRGTFFPPGKPVPPNARKLHLFIEGESRFVVDKAKHEIARLLRESILASVEHELKNNLSNTQPGRYSVV